MGACTCTDGCCNACCREKFAGTRLASALAHASPIGSQTHALMPDEYRAALDSLRASLPAKPSPEAASVPRDPLDVVIDGITLGTLLVCSERTRRENTSGWRQGAPHTWTAAQRAAVSAHWSTELRAKVAAGPSSDAEQWRRERAAAKHEPQVVVDLEDW